MGIFFFYLTYQRLAEISAEFPLYLKVQSYRQSSCIVILISQSYDNHVEPQQHIIYGTRITFRMFISFPLTHIIHNN
jgi:hypothetical protein